MNAIPNQPDNDDPPMSLKALYVLLWRNRTKLLGYALVIAGAVAGTEHTPAWLDSVLLAIGGGGVAGLGHLNSALLRKQQVNP